MSRLLVREKVFTMAAKEFEIKAGFFSGPIFTVEDDLGSIHDRRKLFDEDGRKVYEMKTKVLSARRSMRIKNVRTGSVEATVRRAKLLPIRVRGCLLYTSPSPRDQRGSRMPSSA